MENPTLFSEDVSTHLDEIETSEVIEENEGDGTVETIEPESLDSDAQLDEESISLSDIAANFGLTDEDLDIDDDGQVVFKTKIDGKEGRLKASELKTAYQKQGHLDNLTREATAKLESIKQRESEVETKYAEKLQAMDDVYNLGLQQINHEYQSINWKELEEDDPGRAANLKLDFQNRHNQVVNTLQQIANERNRKANEFQNNYIQEQETKLYSLIPEWTDYEVGKKELSEVQQYGMGLGFNQNQLLHAGTLAALRKAKMYDDLQTKQPEITKQVRKARKVARPGVVPKKETPKRAADILFNKS